MSGLLMLPSLGMNLCNISNNVLWFCVMVLMFCVMVSIFCITVLIFSSKSFCFSFRMSSLSSSLLSSTTTSSSLSNVLLFYIFSFRSAARDFMSFSIFSICSFSSAMVLDLVCGGVYFHALIPKGATESGFPLVEFDYHCNNEYE